MADKTILHEDAVRAVIVDEGGTNFALQTGLTAVAAPTAPGASYNQTEMATLKTAIDAIRAALTASKVTL